MSDKPATSNTPGSAKPGPRTQVAKLAGLSSPTGASGAVGGGNLSPFSPRRASAALLGLKEGKKPTSGLHAEKGEKRGPKWFGQKGKVADSKLRMTTSQNIDEHADNEEKLKRIELGSSSPDDASKGADAHKHRDGESEAEEPHEPLESKREESATSSLDAGPKFDDVTKPSHLPSVLSRGALIDVSEDDRPTVMIKSPSSIKAERGVLSPRN
uniref:Uncharacterized protein n=1 Tax=Erythrolobus australicus TaxID=1077150 RepID=A0A7S1XJ84_9RHOD|mmetsp:Transcript_4864/g.13042  ORF Transcript_4864/g.13042 Transcript_4864/m.13042 type:complete len:213 (+) Transcript_4864:170-808(+)